MGDVIGPYVIFELRDDVSRPRLVSLGVPMQTSDLASRIDAELHRHLFLGKHPKDAKNDNGQVRLRSRGQELLAYLPNMVVAEIGNQPAPGDLLETVKDAPIDALRIRPLREVLAAGKISLDHTAKRSRRVSNGRLPLGYVLLIESIIGMHRILLIRAGRAGAIAGPYI